jgi:hypothetical protein
MDEALPYDAVGSVPGPVACRDAEHSAEVIFPAADLDETLCLADT